MGYVNFLLPRLTLIHIVSCTVLTDINESTGRPFAELLALVTQCHLDDTGNMSGRCLHSDGMRCDHLTPDQHRSKDHLQPVEEVVAHDNHLRPTGRPALAGGNRLDARRGHRKRGIETCNGTRQLLYQSTVIYTLS